MWWAEKTLKMGKVPPETSPRIPAELCSPDLLPEAKFCRKSPVVRQDFESPKAPGGGSNTDVARAARATIRLRERERERERELGGRMAGCGGRWAATKMYPYIVFLVIIWAGLAVFLENRWRPRNNPSCFPFKQYNCQPFSTQAPPSSPPSSENHMNS